MHKTNGIKVILRYLVVILMGVPLTLMFILIPWTSNLALLIIFKTLFPCLIGGFLAFGIT